MKEIRVPDKGGIAIPATRQGHGLGNETQRNLLDALEAACVAPLRRQVEALDEILKKSRERSVATDSDVGDDPIPDSVN